MVGVILAGGTGTRLGPITQVCSKQLLPVFDKPMIYYPLALLMATGIQEFIIICTPRDKLAFETLLGDGSKWGIELTVLVQEKPEGLPHALGLCHHIIGDRASTMILGDNIFYGSGIAARIANARKMTGATMFGYLVDNVSPFGTFKVNSSGQPFGLVEKPVSGGRGFAIPGIYHFDHSVFERISKLKLSTRGEYEIIDLLNSYLIDNLLTHYIFDRGTAWLDTGSVQDLNGASEFIRVIQTRQGMLIGSPEEVAFRSGWIDAKKLLHLSTFFEKSEYGNQLQKIATG